MNRLVLFLIGISLVIFGCVSEDKGDIQAKLNESFSLRINESAYIQSENLLINFTDVAQDSRCPSDVLCVWAGSVTIHLKVSKRSGDTGSMHGLVLSTENDTATFTDSFNNSYSIEMVDVAPYPVSTKTIDPSEYSATLKVERE